MTLLDIEAILPVAFSCPNEVVIHTHVELSEMQAGNLVYAYEFSS